MGIETAEVKERRVAVNGVELHVLDAGSGDPVVLLHGWPQHGRIWRHLVPALARSHRVLVPDLRGFGRSEAPPGDYRKHVFVDDLLALLDAEGIERAALVAHDWGAWAAWLTALEHPERVSRFVAIDIPPPPGEFKLGRALRQLRGLWYQFVLASPVLGRRLIGHGAPVRVLIRGGSGKGMRWSEEDLMAYSEPLREPARARMSVALYRTFAHPRGAGDRARAPYTASAAPRCRRWSSSAARARSSR